MSDFERDIRTTNWRCKMMVASWRLAGGIIITAFLLTGCGQSPSALDPRGPVSAGIADIFWLMFAIAFAVFVMVVAALVYGILRQRRGESEESRRPISSTTYIIAGAMGLSTIILMGMMAVDIRSVNKLTVPPKSPVLTFEVTGRQWWWAISYPDAQVTTANEIHVPAGQPVEARVASADVIHSFWAPQLQGKVDLIPGTVNPMWFQADDPGVYRGQCAEYCGVQHAHMAFHIVADPPEEFRNWLDNQAKPAAVPSDPVARQGMEMFLRGICPACHTIRGTDAQGKVGPDLTHVGSRMWIAAGTSENTRENRAKWIADAQKIKPGNKMPNFGLDPQSDFPQSVATYLGTLK